MANPKVDDKSVMTYVSMFPEAQLKEGAPLRTSKSAADPSKVVVTGPGINGEAQECVEQPLCYTIDTTQAGDGQPEVTVDGPDGCNKDVDMEETSDGVYQAKYTPDLPGDYKVHVNYCDMEVPSSPANVHIADPSKVVVTGPGINGEAQECVEQPLCYTIDTTQAGDGKPEVTVDGPDGCNKDVDIQEISDGVYQAKYTPDLPGDYKVHVNYCDTEVPSSPANVHVADPSKVVVTGPGINGEAQECVEQPLCYTIDTTQAGDGKPEVTVDGPDGCNKDVDIQEISDGVYQAKYTPDLPGDYKVHVNYCDTEVPSSPANVHVADPSKVVVTGPGINGEAQECVEQPLCYTIDTTQAGDGKPEVTVDGPDGCNKDVDIQEISDGVYQAKYTPDLPGDYKVHVNYCDTEVPSSPANVHVADPSKVVVTGPGINGEAQECVEQPLCYTIDTTQAGDGQPEVTVDGPDGCNKDVDIQETSDGIYQAKYTPDLPGDYKVHVNYCDTEVPSSPANVHVADPSKVVVTGPGINGEAQECVEQPLCYTIDTTQAGDGKPEVTVDGPDGCNKDVDIEETLDGVYQAKYTPDLPGDYKVHVNYCDTEVPSSPANVHVADPSKVVVTGPGINDESCECVENPLLYAIDTSGAGPGDVRVTVDGPDGSQELEVVDTGDDMYTAEFTPKDPGQYQVHINYNDKEVPSSPATVDVVDPGKVIISGDIGAYVKVDTPARFNVNAVNAGKGDINAKVHGPSDTDLVCEDVADGSKNYTFTPNVVGDHIVTVDFADKPVPNSPFSIKAYDPSKVEVTGSGITGDGARVGLPAVVEVDATKSGEAPVAVSVRTPSGEVSVVEMTPENESGIYKGDYLPQEPGIYDVDVKYGNEPVPDSPFHAPIPDPESVTVQVAEPELEAGVDWQDSLESSPLSKPILATVDKPTTLDIYTNESAPGKLEAIFDPDPSEAPLDYEFTEVEPGHQQLTFTPHDAAPRNLAVLCNGHPVGEPHKIIVRDPRAVKAYGPGIGSNLPAHHITEIFIDTSEAGPGKPTCSIIDPLTNEVEFTLEKGEDKKWVVQYTPEIPGHHTVALDFVGCPISDSPYKVFVYDPTRVKAYGPGLKKAYLFGETEFTVETTEAGGGEVEITPDGPQDVGLEVTDEQEGKFHATYTPLVTGLYTFHIKYKGVNVPGSPYEVPVVRPPPDASKCVMEGFNEEEPENPGDFIIDAEKAGGSGVLEVSGGESETPANHLSVDHMGNFKFKVKFDMPGSGNKVLNLKWHGEHVPGSPFNF